MSPADRAALLERATHQGLRYDERVEEGHQRALVRDACAALGCDESCAAHRVRNRNADLWTIEASDGRWLLKILTSKPAATIECEYAHLEELHALAAASGAFRVPRPRMFFEGRSAYLMEFVGFRPLSSRLLERSAPSVAELRACGRALATVHEAWAGGTVAFDAAAAAADLRHLPWTPAAREAAMHAELLGHLDGRPFANARLYLDFDPVNIGRVDGRPLLLDPPDRRAIDAVQWDLGVFLFGLRRAAWRRPSAARRHASRLAEMRRAFVEGYAGSSRDPLDAGGAALVGLAELARLGQLWRWWLEPLRFRHRALGIARAAYAWPLLRVARRRLVRELEQTG